MNLNKRTDRRIQMERQLEKLALCATRIPAVEPAELTQEQRQFCKRSFQTPDPIIDLELCCNLSHKRALQTFLTTKADFAVIFEDDAIVADDLPELINTIDASGMKCDLLRIETFLDRCHFGVTARAHFGRYAAHTMHGYTWGTAGYVINRKAAQIYLDTPKMLGIIADRALWRRFPDATGIKTLQLIPAPVAQQDRFPFSQGNSDSDIEPHRKPVYKNIEKNEPVLAMLQRFWRDEVTIALPGLISRGLKKSTRGIVPFSGHYEPAKPAVTRAI
ncbi:glycosyltransferase family 25 protein [Devosia honganensis]|uniref:Glycosyltransferase family 25 protein n=1 Tax=Devosia honganensis TaxID=1610527 RepID=A0ABV7X095_9HYPH